MMKSVSVSCLAVMVGLGLAMPVSAQEARARGNLGGGLIEFLVTGNAGRAQTYAPVVQQSVPVRHTAAVPAYATGQGGAMMLPDEPEPAPRAAPSGAPRLAPMPQVSGFDAKYERQQVSYSGPHRAGTIVIDTPNRFLYLVGPGGTALRYGIGVGRPGFEWAGVKSVTRKAEWPSWTPPSEMLKRRPDLPRFMAGGPDNPLGARALYLGSSLYRIHGTNEPSTIGQAVSSGCIRMRNEDVTDLYERVRVGSKVVVI